MLVERCPPTRKTALLLFITITTCVTLVYYYSIPIALPLNAVQTILLDTVDDSFFVKTSGCRISRLDPFDASIAMYLEGTSVNCSIANKGNSGPPLVKAIEGKGFGKSILAVIETSLVHYNVSPPNNKTRIDPTFYCVYRPFNRKTPDPNDTDLRIDTSIVYGEASRPFRNTTRVPPGAEFIRVNCFWEEDRIYEDFIFLPSENPIHKYNVTSSTSSAPASSSTPTPPSPSHRHGSSDPRQNHSVLVFSLDSISRLNFIREMPRLYRYLTKNLDGLDMTGYHKVGDNTFPNLIALLTGHSENETESTCWNKKGFFDKCPFVWKEFKKMGFITSYVEDEPTISGFNYLKKGFEHQPTDYYPRPLYLEAERAFGHHEGISSNTKLCMGKRLNVEFLVDLQTTLLLHLRNEPKFGFFWENSLTHDYSYFPRLSDALYEGFLRSLVEKHALKNTFIIFLSDHGIRWGSIRNTYQGRIEERMPFLILVPPEWFRNKYPLAYQNLKRNINKLTTPYDVHRTMIDLSNLSSIENLAILEREDSLMKNRTLPKAYSLFTPVSEARTCADAAIPADYCACHDRIDNLSVTDLTVQEAAAAAVVHLNQMLSNHSDLCATLHLHRIRDAKVERSSVNGVFVDEGGRSDALSFYSILIETVPGNALFEATLKYRIKPTTGYEVVGTISRTNLYKGQSECVDDYRLRLYCYCKSKQEE